MLHDKFVRSRYLLLPTIRLEEFGAWKTRGIIFCTYIAVGVAIFLSVFLHLGYERESIVMQSQATCGDLPQLGDTPTGSGCIYPPKEGSNMTVFEGIVSGLNIFDGDVSLSLKVISPNISSNVFLFYYDSQLEGHGNDGAWWPVLSVLNASGTLYCNPTPNFGDFLNLKAGQRDCEPVQLFDTASVTDGQGTGGWSDYKMTVTLYNVDLSTFAQNTTMIFAYQNAQYRVVDSSIRIILLAGTVLALLWWLKILFWQNIWQVNLNADPQSQLNLPDKSRVFVPWRALLRQQRWVTNLLFVTIFWQNPIYIITETFSSSVMTLSASSANLRIVTIAMQSTGWAALFTFWWAMADGSKVSETTLLKLKELGMLPRRPPKIRNNWFAKICCCARRSCCRRRHLNGIPIYATSGWAFYLPKFIFFSILTGSSIVLQVLSHPAILGQSTSLENTFMEDAPVLLIVVATVGTVYFVTLILWAFLFMSSLFSTGYQLRHVPYAQTRHQQLSFRFLLFQYLVVVLFVLVVNFRPIVTFFIQLYFHQNLIHGASSASPSSSAIVASIEVQVAALVQAVSQPWSDAGQALLVSTYVIVLAMCYAPPSSPHSLGVLKYADDNYDGSLPAANSSTRAERVSKFMLEVLIAPIELTSYVTSALSGELRSTLERVLGLPKPLEYAYNLHLISAMFDFANCAYFDPVGMPPTSSSCGPLLEAPHGFSIEGTASDGPLDTFAVIFRRDHRVVISFRGTSSNTNLRSDLTFAPGKVRFGDPDKPSGGLAERLPGASLYMPSVHTGFFTAYQSIREQCVAHVRSSLAQAGPNARLYVVGHSLGGALATFAAQDLLGLVRQNKQAFQALGNPRKSSFFGGGWFTRNADNLNNNNNNNQNSDNYGLRGERKSISRSTSDMFRGIFNPKSIPGVALENNRERESLIRTSSGGSSSSSTLSLGTALTNHLNGVPNLPGAPGIRPGAAGNRLSARERQNRADEEAKASLEPLPWSGKRDISNRFSSHSLAVDLSKPPAYVSSGRSVVSAASSNPYRTNVPRGSVESGALQPLGGPVGIGARFARSRAKVNRLNTFSQNAEDKSQGVQVVEEESAVSVREERSSSRAGLLDNARFPSADEPVSTSLSSNLYSPREGADGFKNSAPLNRPLMAEDEEDSLDIHFEAADLLVDPLISGTDGDPADCVGLPCDVVDWDADEDPSFSALNSPTGGLPAHSTRRRDPPEITLVTFGAPRVGNRVWAAQANRRVPKAFRVIHDGDLVTGIPDFWGYFKHTGIEVWLDRLGNCIVEPSFVEKQFRTSMKTSLSAHRMNSYRRALIYARRNEGLIQFRIWKEQQIQAQNALQSASTASTNPFDNP